MTVLVGIVCEDGVVIGSDSVETFGDGLALSTIEQQGAIKINIIGNKIITATTGSVGLAQRFNRIVNTMNGANQLSRGDAVEQGTCIACSAIEEFRRTVSARQNLPQFGWGLGALVALPVGQRAELFEFDPVQFHPERRGDTDTEGKDRTSRIVSMGSGRSIADPFLGFIRGIFWKDSRPRLNEAKLMVAWTLLHVISLNTGGVGGDVQLATLQKEGTNWKAAKVEPDEIQEQIGELESYLGNYRNELDRRIRSGTAPVPRPNSA